MAVVCPTGGHLHRERGTAIYRVGDRLAHIPPFTGDGLAIALTSAALAVGHIRRGSPPDAYLAAARRLTASPIRLASIVSGLARSSRGRNLMLGAAACAPGLIGTIVRRTRLTLAADGF
jgi:flavin-dependent dehydrogenase